MKSMHKITVCNHPEGIKPICRCGANAICPICGFGHGVSPCDCERIDAAVGKYKDRFVGAWKALA